MSKQNPDPHRNPPSARPEETDERRRDQQRRDEVTEKSDEMREADVSNGENPRS